MWFQSLLVAIIVLLAVLFALWRLPGTATRLRYVAWLKRQGGEHSPLRWLGLRLEARLLRTEGGACSGCSAAGDHGASTPVKPLRK